MAGDVLILKEFLIFMILGMFSSSSYAFRGVALARLLGQSDQLVVFLRFKCFKYPLQFL